MSNRTGQPFVISFASGGRAELRITNRGAVRRGVGKWRLNDLGLFCYLFTQFFARRQERCLITEQRGQTRFAIIPGGKGIRWEFRGGGEGIDQHAPELVGPRGLTANQIFANTDLDSDGRLTKAEFHARRGHFPLLAPIGTGSSPNRNLRSAGGKSAGEKQSPNSGKFIFARCDNNHSAAFRGLLDMGYASLKRHT